MAYPKRSHLWDVLRQKNKGALTSALGLAASTFSIHFNGKVAVLISRASIAVFGSYGKS